MFLKRFRFNVIIQIIFLLILIFLFCYLLLQTNLYATIFIIAVIIIFQTYALIRYVEKTNQYLKRFFDAVKYSDFSQSFTSTGLGSSFDELKAAFTDVIKAFQKSRAEKEEHFRYLQTVVQHIGIGLLAFQPDGDVELINTAAKKLFKTGQIKNIKSLEAFSSELVKKLLLLKSGEKALIKIYDKDELLQLAIYATEFKLRNKKITLVSIQDIQGELEEKEMEAWQNLIRILTHEIMNSITPISSLASTVNQLLIKETPGNYTNKEGSFNIDDIRSSVQTIQKRSEGLLHFVDTYRKLTRLPKPNFQIIPISDLFEQVSQLMHSQIQRDKINLIFKVTPKSLELTADPELIEQVLINLLLNSAQALNNTKEAQIELNAFLNKRGRVVVQVTDNGCGLLPEVQDKIFIPFFTTKKEGSGIGLSLCRQIMRLHSGTINVQSEPNIKTVFSLRF
jgi:nitrogen fixation/metabolism regulation signal transduction histidine kinase